MFDPRLTSRMSRTSFLRAGTCHRSAFSFPSDRRDNLRAGVVLRFADGSGPDGLPAATLTCFLGGVTFNRAGDPEGIHGGILVTGSSSADTGPVRSASENGGCVPT